MKPKTFFKKLSEKIDKLDSETKKEIFCKNNLKIFKKVSEYCQENKKSLVLTDTEDKITFSKVIKYFKLSTYHTRRGVAIFLTNFKGLVYNRLKDDRYRFLRSIYPNSGEYKKKLKQRNEFFENVLK